jgi:hypothetical protein
VMLHGGAGDDPKRPSATAVLAGNL